MDRAALNNRANQLNPNNIAYWMSRGYSEIPSGSNSGRTMIAGTSSALGGGTGLFSAIIMIVQFASAMIDGYYMMRRAIQNRQQRPNNAVDNN